MTGSNASWSGGKTGFAANSAGSGGAIFLCNGSVVDWTADTEFSSNAAVAGGGAVASAAFDSEDNRLESTLAIQGRTTFANNT